MNWIHLEYESILNITDKAVLFVFDGEEHWVPFSQISPEDRDGLEVGDTDGSVSVTDWIAGQKGLA